MAAYSLAQKGLLDRQDRPTELAFQALPEDFLRRMASNFHFQLIQLKEEKDKAEASYLNTSAELRNAKEQVAKLQFSLDGANRRLALLDRDKIKNVLQTFGFMKIDENWVSVLVALNLIEIALREKAELLGINPNGKFNETLEGVKKAIREREGRVLDSSSAFLKETDLYAFRSKIVHYSLKKNISEKEADLLIELAKKFIEALKLPNSV
jgi:hypothetical protein